MDSRVLEVISSQIEEQVTGIKEHLSAGQSKDYAEYREMCGRVHGLMLALRIAKDLQRNLEQSDE
jgi:hypothetical protein